MMEGLAAVVRSHQTVWLTPAQRAELERPIGLPLDPGGNDCPAVTPDRCATTQTGRWEELPGLPGVTCMHAVLLPTSSRVLFWGYGPRPTRPACGTRRPGSTRCRPTSRPTTGPTRTSGRARTRTSPSRRHVVVHGGCGAPRTRRSRPTRSGARSSSTPPRTRGRRRRHARRPLLPDHELDGRRPPDDHVRRRQPQRRDRRVGSLETSRPAPAAAPGACPSRPFDYYYYPWAFLLPLGDVFIAGPQKPSRRFDPAATPSWTTRCGARPGLPRARRNMEGTPVLLPLKPPRYRPRVMICGGTGATRATWNAGEGGAMAPPSGSTSRRPRPPGRRCPT